MPGVLRVYPSFRSKDEAELRIRKARILEVGLRSAQGRGGGTEFDQLREYTVDDEFRRIDWGRHRPGGPADRAHLPGRAQPDRAGPAGQRPGDGRAGRRRAPGRARGGRGDDADRGGDRARRPLRRGGVRPRGAGRGAPGSGRAQLGRVVEALYDLEPVLAESDYAGRLQPRRWPGSAGGRCWWC